MWKWNLRLVYSKNTFKWSLYSYIYIYIYIYIVYLNMYICVHIYIYIYIYLRILAFTAFMSSHVSPNLACRKCCVLPWSVPKLNVDRFQVMSARHLFKGMYPAVTAELFYDRRKFRFIKSGNGEIVFEECHWRTTSMVGCTMFMEIDFYHQIPCFHGGKGENFLLFRDVTHISL